MERAKRLVYGRNPVQELIRHRLSSVQEVFVLRAAEFSFELSAQLDKLRQAGVPVRAVSRDELDRDTGTDKHQGIYCVADEALPTELSELVSRAGQSGSAGVLVALDQVSDPQNLGAVLRVSESSGVSGVIVPARKSSPLSPAAVKASAGASELVGLSVVTNLRQALLKLKEEGFWIVGASRSPESELLFEASLPLPIVLVLGSEGRGLRKLTRETCDVLVEIPMEGKIDSLNVSQAAAVLLYELLRRRRGVDCQRREK